jgi:hypothetical protein
MLEPLVGEKTVSVRLNPATYRRMELLAKREKRSMSAQAAYLIEDALSRLPPESPATRSKRAPAES